MTWLVVLCVLISSLPAGAVFAQSPSQVRQLPDLQGHWAQETLERWVERGLIQGYGDGTFRPSETITRAEFVALVNRAFGFTAEQPADFSDVPADDWFARDVMRAVAAGYVLGYEDGTFRPNDAISRQEVAVILARLLRLEDAAEAASAFSDAAEIAFRGAVGAALLTGLIMGYPDGTFGPLRAVTRAEAVVLLDRALALAPAPQETASDGVPHAIDKAGIYGPDSGVEVVDGDVTILAPEVTLRNVVITGDLTGAESVGDGDVYLFNVTVRGTTFVRGGGANSVHVADSALSTLVIERTDGRVRVVIGGHTVVEQTAVGSPAVLETGSGASVA